MERAEELVGLPEASQRLDELIMSLGFVKDIKFRNLSEKLSRIDHVLSALNPRNVLARGYSYVTSDEGEVISSSEKYETVPNGSAFVIQFKDGKGYAIKG